MPEHRDLPSQQRLCGECGDVFLPRAAHHFVCNNCLGINWKKVSYSLAYWRKMRESKQLKPLPKKRKKSNGKKRG